MGGAGDGNRTRVTSLEGSSSTIELHPLGRGEGTTASLAWRERSGRGEAVTRGGAAPSAKSRYYEATPGATSRASACGFGGRTTKGTIRLTSMITAMT
jgi:hypothetical protein